MRSMKKKVQPRMLGEHTGDRLGLPEGIIRKVIQMQRGLCVLCQAPLESTYVVDHDHILAARHDHDVKKACVKCFRGVVCRRCNSVLGWGRDDPEYFMRLAAYILNSRTRA